MHHALEMQEILASICSHLSPCDWNTTEFKKATPNLAALARTCHTFKEPALDELWRALIDLSPMVRCVPEASHPVSPQSSTVSSFQMFSIPYFSFFLSVKQYLLTRLLTQTEWDILRSYTHRIQYVHYFGGLDWISVGTFLTPSTTEPLFPNLRSLHCQYTEKNMALLHLPLPSLVSLGVSFDNPRLFQNSVELFPKHSPDIRKLSIGLHSLTDGFVKIEPHYMCRWKNLLRVDCHRVALDMDDLVHLSRMPALTHLSFILSPTLSASDSLLIFSNLHKVVLQSESWKHFLRFLSQTRLPTITDFTVHISDYSPRLQLSSLFSLLRSNTGLTIESLQLYLSSDLASNVIHSETLPLSFQDLWPCMAFSNLRHMELDIECNVHLTDSHVLMLASAWPKLNKLLINEAFGWNTTDGITPGGLVRLLQTCPSLHSIALRLDRRGYTEVPASLGLTFPFKTFFIVINVLDSVIEVESVPALATFFCYLRAACSSSKSHFGLYAWDDDDTAMMKLPNATVYAERWWDVRHKVYDGYRWGDDWDRDYQ